jgi:MFS family permease
LGRGRHHDLADPAGSWAGGEWGGQSPATGWGTDEPGFAGSWAQFGSPLGLLAALLVLTAVSSFGSSAWFETIGWRIPFLISVVLIGIGFWIRLGILETMAFKDMQAKGTIENAPVAVAIKQYWREILLVCGIRSGQHAALYLFSTFVLSYGVGTLHLSRDLLFDALLLACCVSLGTVLFFGHLSDRIGRRTMYIIGGVTPAIFAFYYAMLETASPVIVVVAIVLSLVVHDMSYGPQPAFVAKHFLRMCDTAAPHWAINSPL